MNLEVRNSGSFPELLHRELTDRIIGCGLRVPGALGPGFLESIYAEPLGVEFSATGSNDERQKPLSILYRDTHIGQHRLDFLIENKVVLANKASHDRFSSSHGA
jgi:GxxExxY protein